MNETGTLDLAATIEVILAGQVRLKRYAESLAAKMEQQDATIAAQNAKIELLTRLTDNHQLVLERAAIKAMPKGTVQ
jgi:hypothetical protein